MVRLPKSLLRLLFSLIAVYGAWSHTSILGWVPWSCHDNSNEVPMLLGVIDHYPKRTAVDDGSRRVSFAQLGERAATWCQWFGCQGLARWYPQSQPP